VNQGSLYPALHRLEEKGWLRSEWRQSETGREAKFYSLTAAGRKQLAIEKRSWDRLANAVGLIFDEGKVAMGKILKMFSWRRRKEQELDRELQNHIDRRIDDLTRSGLAENEAQREASLEFGGIRQVKEEVRDAWKARLLWDLIEDLRYGSRVLLKNPGFAIVAIVSLALGIGANSAIFSVINTVTLRTLPVDAPDELFELRRQGQ